MKLSSGFTLVELLVVIAIISMLAALLLPNYMDARLRARDLQRKNDIKQLQKALELYKLDQSAPVYPTGTNTLPVPGNSWTNTTSGAIYMQKMPGDPNYPTNPTPYYYTSASPYTSYILCTCLENKTDIDKMVISSCGSNTCSQGVGYSVSNP